MSTKFSSGQKLQKTPRVCKKPPPDLPDTLEYFVNYQLQGFASWTLPAVTHPEQISGIAKLDPDPVAMNHQGEAGTHYAALRIELYWRAPSNDFLLLVRLIRYGIEQDRRSIVFSNVSPGLPFSAGLFTWNDPVLQEYVSCKIFS
jgi:hypothetical protein